MDTTPSEDHRLKPFTFVEHSVRQFNDVLIPHRLDMLEKHKININKCLRLKDYRRASKEQTVASNLISTLAKDVMGIEALKSQVCLDDRTKFENSIATSKKKTMQAIQEFMDAYPSGSCGQQSQHDIGDEEDDDSGYAPSLSNVFIDTPQLLIYDKSHGGVLSVEEEAFLQSHEKLRIDIQDLKETFINLECMVKEQSEQVESIVENVEETHELIAAGSKSLATAAMYKTTLFPLFGATLGAAIGGPIGLIVGMKTGAGLIVGGSVLGFVGGTLLKRKAKAEENKKSI